MYKSLLLFLKRRQLVGYLATLVGASSALHICHDSNLLSSESLYSAVHS